METIVVTGGAGFIGTNFVRHALARTDARIVVLDALTYAGNLESLADVASHPRYAFVQADIADRAAVRALLRDHRPSAIVNFAAETHVDRSIDDPASFVRTNVTGAFELLEAARLFLRESREAAASFRFLHVSTDEVYGTLGATGAFSETTAYAPNSPYAASKAGADHLVRAYHETYRLPALVTNCSNNYGPFQFPEKLIPLMILNAVEGKSLPIYGDGGNVRDWLYVEDHCEGILLVLRKGRSEGSTTSAAATSARTCRWSTRCAPPWTRSCRRRRTPPSWRAVSPPTPASRPSWLTGPATTGDTRSTPRRSAPSSAGRHATTFEDGLRETVRWYLANRPWCEAVQSGQYRRERLGLA